MASLTSAESLRGQSDVFDLGFFLRPLASLKLTVVLFVAAMVIVLVGTLAQDEQNMYQVKETYFNSLFVVIPLDVFVPQPFYPHSEPMFQVMNRPLGLPFPGGALIGLLLLVNLVAAKLVRFKVSAKGGKATFGVIISVIGFALIAAVIMAAQSGEGLQGRPPFSYETLWLGIRLSLVLSGAGLVAWSRTLPQYRWLQRGLYALAGLTSLAGLVLLFNSFQPSEPSLRILWQLVQGGLASIPLLIGFVVLFGRRGANALVHFGVGLLMIGQFAFGDRQLEQRLTLVEGEVTNVLRNLDAVELAVIDRSNPETERVISIPASRLRESLASQQPLVDERLPFSVEVLEYFPNSMLTGADKAEKNLSDRGYGLEYVAVPRPPSGGAQSNTDFASAYVRLKAKDSDEVLGSYLVSQFISDWKLMARRSDQSDELEKVQVADQSFEMGLRFQRIPKPFWIKLDDVERTNYSGSETPRDYSSFIRLVDNESGDDRKERIWMNNPLRYKGETFYQSNYDRLDDGLEVTGIQVVANDGWMIPYVSCMLVLIGLTVHFSDTLVRFVGRQERSMSQPNFAVSYRKPMWIAAGVSMLVLLGMLWPRQSGPDEFDLYQAGKIPVSSGGRVMPLDALAQQTLQAASNKTSIALSETDQRGLGRFNPGKKMPAIQWLFEVASGNERAERLPLFRIDAQEVLSELDLGRSDNNRYSISQLRPQAERFNELVEKAREQEKLDPLKLTFKQRKLLELDQRVRAFTLLSAAFEPLDVPDVPTEAEMLANPDVAQETMNTLRSLVGRSRSLERMNAPAIIPPTEVQATDEQGKLLGNLPPWVPLNSARVETVLTKFTGEGETSETLDSFNAIVDSYRSGDAQGFNRAVERHLSLVAAAQPGDYSPRSTSVERWLHAANPSTNLASLYILAAVLTFAGFLVAGQRIRPATLGLLMALLVVHTIALIARIVVTGRPPVINLYSSAVFIGWSLVVAGIVFELIFRNGIGNLTASLAGGATLLVAYGLDTGDTMGVLQAVLDTQFWLSTHVITVALGYSATFLAGLLGIFYLVILAIQQLGSQPKPSRDALMHDVYRMTYGVVCFGILFSFIGTVLGGLWADDSWGRFWGWDPKENGALLIVLWNALLLHARWDRWVGPRGFSLLAVGGNIVTAWSWFGTNQLGIGLHSYGFTTGVLIALGLFAFSQLLIIFVAMLVTSPRAGDRPSGGDSLA